MPNVLLIIAAVVLAFIGAAHTYLGERSVLPRLLALENLPLLLKDRAYTQNVLRYAWHLTSVAWAAFAAILFALAFGRMTLMIPILSGTFFVHGLTILATAGIRHPAWFFFLLAGALTAFS